MNYFNKNDFYEIVGPEEVKRTSKKFMINKLLTEVNSQLKSVTYSCDSELIVSLHHERYSKEIRDICCDLYKQQGWKEVIHNTSSENGERAGLTVFKFYM